MVPEPSSGLLPTWKGIREMEGKVEHSRACMHAYNSLWPHGPPSSSVHGIFQAWILEWGGPFRPRDQTWVSCFSCTDRQILLPLCQQGSLKQSRVGAPRSLWKLTRGKRIISKQEPGWQRMASEQEEKSHRTFVGQGSCQGWGEVISQFLTLVGLNFQMYVPDQIILNYLSPFLSRLACSLFSHYNFKSLHLHFLFLPVSYLHLRRSTWVITEGKLKTWRQKCM